MPKNRDERIDLEKLEQQDERARRLAETLEGDEKAGCERADAGFRANFPASGSKGWVN
jgi:hypothetical protein